MLEDQATRTRGKPIHAVDDMIREADGITSARSLVRERARSAAPRLGRSRHHAAAVNGCGVPHDGGRAPAPSPDEVAAAVSSPSGGWSAKQLAAWGVPWPPPKGWRRELERRHRLGLDVEPVTFTPKRERRAQAAANPAGGAPLAVPATVAVRDTGTIDPDDPPPWL